jgi:uncharacterized protein
MHTAYFRFYEELNDFLPFEKRKVRFGHKFLDRTSVKDMIESLGVPHSEIDLILVNGSSVDFSHIICDGDDISVYPVFESTDISKIQHLRESPLRNPKFILDVHLGKLARYLRMTGFDSWYSNSNTKDGIIKISLLEKRTILTKDRNLLKNNAITHGYWVRNENPVEQVKEVIWRFDLKDQMKEFSRCLDCNQVIMKVEKAEIENELPPKVRDTQNEFYRCTGCKRIFWKGRQYIRMLKLINLIKD